MATYGLTDSGFVVMPLEDIQSEIEGDLQVAFNASIDLAAQSNWGQFVGIISERLSLIWQVLEAVYTAFGPDGASGAQLVNLCALTGTVPTLPSSSRVTATCCGTPGTVLPANRVASVAVVGTRFATALDATIAAAAAWAGAHTYAIGDRVTANGKVFEAIASTGVTSGAAPSGATALGDSVVDGGVTWRCVGTGTGSVDVDCAAQTTGPLSANAGTLARIETPVSGWSTVYNNEDAYSIGSAGDTDPKLRLRRETELRAQGNAAVEAIRAAVEQVAQVTSCYVFENTTDVVDANGLPPHSVEVLVQALDLTDVNDAIRAAIFAAVGGGIATNGTVNGTVTDSQGTAWPVNFSRVAQVPIYVKVEASIDPDNWPTDGADQITAALLAYAAATYQNGSDVISAALNAQPFKVSGVVDCVVKVSTAPSPTSTATIPISLRQLAVLDSSRITVVATPRVTS